MSKQLTLRIDVPEDKYDQVIMVDKIVSLSKTPDGEYTLIHLMNGTVLRSYDSMNTIEARLNSD